MSNDGKTSLEDLAVKVENMAHGDPVASKLWDDVSKSMKDFQTSPSAGGFANMVEKSTSLGMESEVVGAAKVLLYNRDSAKDKSATKDETLAGLYAGMGNMWLTRGTKLDPNDPWSHDDRGRILAGDGYDLGGDAASLYSAAGDKLAQAKEQKGVTPADNARIADEQALVNDQLSKIYGGHNIDAIYKELRSDLDGKFGAKANFSLDQLERFESRLRSEAMFPDGDQPAAQDPRYRGKMYRDAALVDLALADFKGSRGDLVGANIYYDSAVKYLNNSKSFDANSADAKQLQEIAEQVKKRI